MLAADLPEGFSGLKQWSEPVIYDRLIAAYFKLISDREWARSLNPSCANAAYYDVGYQQ